MNTYLEPQRITQQLFGFKHKAFAEKNDHQANVHGIPHEFVCTTCYNDVRIISLTYEGKIPNAVQVGT